MHVYVGDCLSQRTLITKYQPNSFSFLCVIKVLFLSNNIGYKIICGHDRYFSIRLKFHSSSKLVNYNILYHERSETFKMKKKGKTGDQNQRIYVNMNEKI